MIKSIFKAILLLIGLVSIPLSAQETVLDLPDPLITQRGKKVKKTKVWTQQRRPEILELFRSQVYGKVPDNEIKVRFDVDFTDRNALCGQAVSKSVTAHFYNAKDSVSMNIMIYLPKDQQGPAPLFLGLNFYGNHTVHFDPNIPISKSWARNNPLFFISNNELNELSRGIRASRWPLERIIERGYGLAAIYYGDIDPDYHDDFKNGIHALIKDARSADTWGSISAWSWGLSQAMDYFETDPDIDEQKVAVIGHSRLGKTSLWAGAQDERFALVISNNSGCGGAALSKRKFGERVGAINKSFPHWFCKNFRQYNGKEEKLPLDQHMLIALMAPRPVYIASAQRDEWADPTGEYLSLYHAAPVYKLFGHRTKMSENRPEINHPFQSGPLGYHIRSGAHDITRYDWEQYLKFADYHFSKK